MREDRKEWPVYPEYPGRKVRPVCQDHQGRGVSQEWSVLKDYRGGVSQRVRFGKSAQVYFGVGIFKTDGATIVSRP